MVQRRVEQFTRHYFSPNLEMLHMNIPTNLRRAALVIYWRFFARSATLHRVARVIDRRFFSNNATAFIDRLKQKSMLHRETLTLLQQYAGQARGAILEIGPYIGGSTIAMATGAKEGVPVISVEVGGSHDNPRIPSNDILADLRRNLEEYNVNDRVSIVQGWSNHADTIARVESLLGPRKADLFFVDSDGAIARDFPLYRRFLSDQAVIVLDDYFGVTGIKEGPVQAFVKELTGSGQAKEIGIYQYATWFGRLQPSNCVAPSAPSSRTSRTGRSASG